MASGKRRPSSSRFIRVNRQSTAGKRRPDPEISIDVERLRNVLSRLEGLSGQ
ncbi:MAG: hypothetical protein AAFY78_06370 [Cyanobacteria bacterium J06648_16]